MLVLFKSSSSLVFSVRYIILNSDREYGFHSNCFMEVLVEALRHKQGGSELDSLQVFFFFWKISIDLSVFSGPVFHSLSNINEYQGIFLGVTGNRCVELTALPSKLCRMSN